MISFFPLEPQPYFHVYIEVYNVEGETCQELDRTALQVTHHPHATSTLLQNPPQRNIGEKSHCYNMNIRKEAKRHEQIYVSLREMEKEEKLSWRLRGQDPASLQYATVYLQVSLILIYIIMDGHRHDIGHMIEMHELSCNDNHRLDNGL